MMEMTPSLTGGTFVLLVRLFSFLAVQVPSAGLRKENGKMKIKYEFVNGEVSEIEVEEKIGEIIVESRRLESNADRKERYHCYSMDAAEYEGLDYGTEETPETLIARREEDRHLYEIFCQLSETQQRRLLMLGAGLSIREIARRENANFKTVYESIEAGRRKFKKLF